MRRQECVRYWGAICNYARRLSVELLQRAACDCGKTLTVRLQREASGAWGKNISATWRCYFDGLPVGALAGLTMPCSKFFSLEMVQISSPMSHGFNLYVLVTPQDFV